ncbi:hypothetical protein BC834DRAFT_466067 [Gloeopeniophorella convolvens]|nr:hypothetical protein BC834DRAFT_466067 [Gloeopeniophorella convolvens]
MAGVNIPETLGTLTIGVFLNALLYGIVLHQCLAFWYRRRFKDDFGLNLLVAGLLASHTFHLTGLCYVIWDYSVTNYGDPVIVHKILWPMSFTPLIMSTQYLPTNIYMARRLYSLTRSWWQLVLTISVSMVSCAFGFLTSITGWQQRVAAVHGHPSTSHQVLVIAWHSLQVATALLITGLLTYALCKSRGSSILIRSDAVVSYLIVGAIQTGLYATVFATATLVTWVVCENTTVYAVFGINLGLIYTSALMSTFLSRDGLGDESTPNSRVSQADKHAQPVSPLYVQSCTGQTHPDRESV